MQEEQVLQLQELEEENRRKLAEAKLTELELIDVLSQATDQFHETFLGLVNTRRKPHPRECLPGLVKLMNLRVFQINRRPIQLISTT